MPGGDKGDPRGQKLREDTLPWEELEERLPIDTKLRMCGTCKAMRYGRCLIKDAEGEIKIPRNKICDVPDNVFELWQGAEGERK